MSVVGGGRFGRSRLTLGASAVLLLLVLALGVTVRESQVCDRHWMRVLAWDSVIVGAHAQVEGIKEQRAAEALLASTFDPVYRAAFERGVRDATAGSKLVIAVGDARISAIARRAERADLRHDHVVPTELFRQLRPTTRLRPEPHCGTLISSLWADSGRRARSELA
jgi:hypothetical protein